jgi:hypothetical protein
MRIEYQQGVTTEILHESDFHFAESDVIYAAHAYLMFYMDRADVDDPGDVRLYVWPCPRGEEPDAHLDYQDAILTVPGTLVLASEDLHEAYDNPYPKIVRMLHEGSITGVASADQWMHDDLTVKTFFWYSYGDLEGYTTGGDTEQFIWRLNAHAEGWAASHTSGGEWKYNVDKIKASDNAQIKAQLETLLAEYYEKAKNNPQWRDLNRKYHAMIGALRAALDAANAEKG